MKLWQILVVIAVIIIFGGVMLGYFTKVIEETPAPEISVEIQPLEVELPAE